MANHSNIPGIKDLMPTVNQNHLPDTFVPDTFTPDTFAPDTIIVGKPDTFVAGAVPDTRILKP